MRAKPDRLTDGSPQRRQSGPSSQRAAALITGLSVFVAVLVVGVWLLRPSATEGSASAAEAPTPPIATASIPAPPVATSRVMPTPTASFGGDTAVEPVTSPPATASRLAARFADAWKLNADPAVRRTALRRVASPYLAKGLARVASGEFPRGAQRGSPRLLVGSAVGGEYLIDFTTGEAIRVTVNLVGDQWRATRVEPAEHAEPIPDTPSSPAPTQVDSSN